MNRIGFLVNPVAGMGGRVGLKGTDDMAGEALRRGARPVSRVRALQTLQILRSRQFLFFTCSAEMGENILIESGISRYSVLYQYSGESTAHDTREACRKFLEYGVDLILFCGGDGTARDVFDGIGDRVPILGIPAGVKMYSAVFAVNPTAAGELLMRNDQIKFRESEVVDVDEDAYRRGELRTRLYGYAKVPYIPEMLQGAKRVYEDPDEERAKEEIARFINELMQSGSIYILGPGTTTRHIAERQGIKKTLLGFDAVRDGRLIGADLDERAILALTSSGERVWLIISPIGAQGFVLGRGTQQVSPEVLKQIGIKHIIVVATPYKLSQTAALFVDTGDTDLDHTFGHYISVISGYRIAQRKRLLHPERT